MKCPVTAITGDKAFHGDEAQPKLPVLVIVEAFYPVVVPGPHHFHMEGEQQALADMLLGFFSTGAIEPASDPIRRVG